eukprot:jgi/Mesvir1/15665/Mv03266-RA.1
MPVSIFLLPPPPPHPPPTPAGKKGAGPVVAGPVFAGPEWQPAVILMDNGQGSQLQRMGMFLRWMTWTLPPSSEEVEGGYFLQVPLSDLTGMTTKITLETTDAAEATEAAPEVRPGWLRENDYKSYLKQTWHSLSRSADTITCDPGPNCVTSAAPTGLSAFEVNDRYLSVRAWPVPQLMATVLPHRDKVKFVMIVDHPTRQVMEAAAALGEGPPSSKAPLSSSFIQPKVRQWIKDELSLLRSCLQGPLGRVTFGGEGFPSSQQCGHTGGSNPRAALAPVLDACAKKWPPGGSRGGGIGVVTANSTENSTVTKAAVNSSVPLGTWYPWLSAGHPEWRAGDAFKVASSGGDDKVPGGSKGGVAPAGGGGDAELARRGLVVEGLFGLVLAQWRCAGFRPDQMLLLPRSLVEQDMGQALRQVADFLGRPLAFKNAIAQGRLNEAMRRKLEPPMSTNDIQVHAQLRGELDAFFAPHSAALMRTLTFSKFGGVMTEVAKELGVSAVALVRAGDGDDDDSNEDKDNGGDGQGKGGSDAESGGGNEGGKEGAKEEGTSASGKEKQREAARKVKAGADSESEEWMEDGQPTLYEDASFVFLFLIILGATLLASVLYTVIFGTSDNVFKFAVAETVGERGTISESLADTLTAHVQALQALSYRLATAGMQPWDIHVIVRAPAEIIGPRDDMWRPQHESSFEVNELPDKSGSIEYQDLPSSCPSGASIAGATIMLETELVMRSLTHPHMHVVEEQISAGFKVVGSIGMAPVEITAPSDHRQGALPHVLMSRTMTFLRKHLHRGH